MYTCCISRSEMNGVLISAQQEVDPTCWRHTGAQPLTHFDGNSKEQSEGGPTTNILAEPKETVYFLFSPSGDFC